MASTHATAPRLAKAGLSSLMGMFGVPVGPRPKASPFREVGVSGTAIFGGYVQTKERDQRVFGQQRWITYSDIATNTSIVAAGVRYFLNLIANADWSVTPADDTPAAKEVAEFVEDVMHDMTTSWARMVRRTAGYRFYGFGVGEWTAKRRKQDGRIGFDDIEQRPQHTIERWDVDERGSVVGMWQRSPQTGAEIYLPRSKVCYLVDDALTDSPEGTGLFRHLVDPALRLQRYLDLEGSGFERDLRGIPVGRAPYGAINAAVKANQITQAQADQLTSAIEQFVQLQSKSTSTSIVLDSAPYLNVQDASVSSQPQWGVDILNGDSSGFADIGRSIDRLNREMARVLNMEQLMLGDGSGGNRALSEDKSKALYLTVNSTLRDSAEGLDRDLINPLCSLNGIADDLRPHLKASDVSFRSISEITAALRDMATAGAVMQPDDPAIDDVRDLLGISRQPEIDPEMMGLLQGNAIGGSRRRGADELSTEEDPADDGVEDPEIELDDEEQPPARKPRASTKKARVTTKKAKTSTRGASKRSAVTAKRNTRKKR